MPVFNDGDIKNRHAQGNHVVSELQNIMAVSEQIVTGQSGHRLLVALCDKQPAVGSCGASDSGRCGGGILAGACFSFSETCCDSG